MAINVLVQEWREREGSSRWRAKHVIRILHVSFGSEGRLGDGYIKLSSGSVVQSSPRILRRLYIHLAIRFELQPSSDYENIHTTTSPPPSGWDISVRSHSRLAYCPSTSTLGVNIYNSLLRLRMIITMLIFIRSWAICVPSMKRTNLL